MTTTTTSSAIKKHTTFNYLKLLQLPLSKTYRYLHATSDRINAIASRILQLKYRQTWCQATKMQILNIIILLYIPETILWLQYFFFFVVKDLFPHHMILYIIRVYLSQPFIWTGTGLLCMLCVSCCYFLVGVESDWLYMNCFFPLIVERKWKTIHSIGNH